MITRSDTSGTASLIRPFYPALDGLRAIAFLAVFSWHFARTIAPNAQALHWGWVGVDQFFALSGFLITGILFDTLHKPDFFRSFYIRRALRIFPLYYTIWIALLLLTPVLHILWNRYNLAMALYVGNLFLPGAGAGLHPTPGFIVYRSLRHAGVTHGILVEHFWSLCVEEQFYLVWPAVVWLVRSRRALIRLCVAGAIASPLLRLVILHFAPQQLNILGLYYPTYVRCDALLLGSALALWLRSPQPLKLAFHRRVAALVLPVSVALLAVGFIFSGNSSLPINNAFVCTIGYSLIAIAAVSVLLLALFPGTRLAAVLQLRPLVALGRISYGLYVIHQLLEPPMNVIIPFLRRRHLVILYPFLGLAISWALAALSFRYLESPFLRLKDRLAHRSGAVADPPPSNQPLAAE
jgi:peptidoglycan/LPS O-acetylase OafA/YrhL